MKIKFASWNIHNATPEAKERCFEYLATQDPDIFGLFEVSSKEAIGPAMKYFPYHSLTSIDNEMIIGVSNRFFSFVSTRNEFKSEKQTLRPGVLATIYTGTEYISFLFLHLKAFSTPLDYGLRDDMYKHLSSLKRALPRDHKTVFAGDFNNVGMQATYNDRLDTSIQEELRALDRRMHAVSMRRKTYIPTWWNGNTQTNPAEIDQIYTSDSVGDITLQVAGWPAFEKTEDQKKFISEYSDHALLIGEIPVL